METNQNPSPSSSPNSSSGSSGNGVRANPPPTPPPPPTPKPLIPPQPTTFVQADAQSFKQMVQLLTGSADTIAAATTRAGAAKNPIPPLSRPKKPSFKLYERRPRMKSLKMIGPVPPAPSASAPRAPLSPSVLNFPSLALSPVTPLIPDPFDRSPHDSDRPIDPAAEERAITDRGFYLHPSPRGAEPPQLLPLFPLTSPRGSTT